MVVWEWCHNASFSWALIKGLIDSMQEVTEEVRVVEECSGGTVHKLCLCVGVHMHVSLQLLSACWAGRTMMLYPPILLFVSVMLTLRILCVDLCKGCGMQLHLYHTISYYLSSGIWLQEFEFKCLTIQNYTTHYIYVYVTPWLCQHSEMEFQAHLSQQWLCQTSFPHFKL